MIASSFTTKTLSLSLLAALLLITGVWLAPRTFAKIVNNTIDPNATILLGGRLVTVTGPITTDQVQSVVMRVTVTQRSTGANAEGYAVFIGTGSLQHWTVQAHTVGVKSFEPGPATIVGLAQTKSHGQPDDAHQWLVNVTLVDD